MLTFFWCIFVLVNIVGGESATDSLELERHEGSLCKFHFTCGFPRPVFFVCKTGWKERLVYVR